MIDFSGNSANKIFQRLYYIRPVFVTKFESEKGNFSAIQRSDKKTLFSKNITYENIIVYVMYIIDLRL